MADLGEIKRVDLREVWPNEAQDFTPWLAENLDKLGEALGLDLELRASEAAVGSFSLDVLAHDLGSNRPVIIENQLEATNHDHLGKLLTYAAGHDAYAAVWLVRDFRDEHRQALDWLNQRTGDDTAFFGVVVEAWRIDESRPAPQFRLVAFPNDWQKRTANAYRGGELRMASEEEQRYQVYFQPIIDAVEGELRYIRQRGGLPRRWCSFHSGFRGIRYGTNFYGYDHSARVEIRIGGGDKQRNEELFDRLSERRERIDIEFGETLDWERWDDYVGCGISARRTGSIDDPPESLKELQDWMVDRLLAFKRVFTPHLAEVME